MHNLSCLNPYNIDSDSIPLSKNIKKYKRLNMEIAEKQNNLFVFSFVSKLKEVSRFVSKANELHHLRALFIKKDVEETWLTHELADANLRAVQKMIYYSDDSIPKRILWAWNIGAQEKLIAKASMQGEYLVVLNCALETFKFEKSKIKALSKVDNDVLDDFEIDEDGSFIYWPKIDVHLNLEALKIAVNPKLREKSRLELIEFDESFGKAISAVRKKHKLTQKDIKGLSERQVRRIEQGSRPRTATLKLMADAHKMNLNDYLNEISLNLGSN